MFYEQNGKAFYTQDGQVYDVEDLISVFKRQSRLNNRLREQVEQLTKENQKLRDAAAKRELLIVEEREKKVDLHRRLDNMKTTNMDQRAVLDSLRQENQKLRDAVVQAPFSKYEVYEDD
jgi:hypothetical protein